MASTIRSRAPSHFGFDKRTQTSDGRIATAIGVKAWSGELQDVRYAVYEAATEGNSDQQASRVFIEPGLDIEASLTVELQSPGAALYVNNPISATGNADLFESPVTEGAIALRASEIYLNADISADSSELISVRPQKLPRKQALVFKSQPVRHLPSTAIPKQLSMLKVQE